MAFLAQSHRGQGKKSFAVKKEYRRQACQHPLHAGGGDWFSTIDDTHQGKEKFASLLMIFVNNIIIELSIEILFNLVGRGGLTPLTYLSSTVGFREAS